jgi:hypothetical protein
MEKIMGIINEFVDTKRKAESGKQFQCTAYFERLSKLQIGNNAKIADVAVKRFGAAERKRHELKIKVLKTVKVCS